MVVNHPTPFVSGTSRTYSASDQRTMKILSFYDFKRSEAYHETAGPPEVEYEEYVRVMREAEEGESEFEDDFDDDQNYAQIIQVGIDAYEATKRGGKSKHHNSDDDEMRTFQRHESLKAYRARKARWAAERLAKNDARHDARDMSRSRFKAALPDAYYDKYPRMHVITRNDVNNIKLYGFTQGLYSKMSAPKRCNKMSSSQQQIFLVAMCKFFNLPPPSSSLNGANGEATGKDDVSNGNVREVLWSAREHISTFCNFALFIWQGPIFLRNESLDLEGMLYMFEGYPPLLSPLVARYFATGRMPVHVVLQITTEALDGYGNAYIWMTIHQDDEVVGVGYSHLRCALNGAHGEYTMEDDHALEILMCMYYVTVIVYMITNMLVKSQLNGSHGEKTNSDDVKGQKGGKGAQNKRIIELNKAVVADNKNIEKKVEEMAKAVEVPINLDFELIVMTETYGYSSKGQVRLVHGLGKAETKLGELFDHITDDGFELIGMKKMLTGSYIMNMDCQTMCIARGAFMRVIIPASTFEIDNVRQVFEEESLLIFRPLIDRELSRLIAANDSVDNQRLMIKIALESYPTVDATILANTIKYFRLMRWQFLYDTICDKRNAQIAKTYEKGPLAFKGNTFSQPVNILLMNDQYRNYQVWRFDPYTSHGTYFAGDINEYVDDTIRTVVKSRGFDVDLKLFHTILEKRVGFFHTTYMVLSGRYRVQYLSNHPYNIPSALKRYMKCPKTIKTDGIVDIEASQLYAAKLRYLQYEFYEAVYCKYNSGVCELGQYLETAGDPPSAPNQLSILDVEIASGAVEPMVKFLRGLYNELYFINVSWLDNMIKAYTDPEEFRVWYAQQPHAKRAERMSLIKIYTDMTKLDPTNVKTQAKLKDEGAKWKAFARLFVSYTSMCLYVPWVFSLVKTSMDGLYSSEGTKIDGQYTSWFNTLSNLCSARYYQRDHQLYIYGDVKKLQACYQRHYDVGNGLYGDHSFSTSSGDDIMCTSFEAGVCVYEEDDVSAYDSSHHVGAFLMTFLILRMFVSLDMALKFIKSHTTPVTLVNPHNRDEYLQLGGDIMSGSGTTDTTSKNTVGVFTAFLVGCQQPGVRIAWDKAFEAVGYVVKREIRPNFQKMTFLKYFPYIVDSQVYVCGCLGKYIKNFGSVYGNLLPEHFPKMSNKEFYEHFNNNKAWLVDQFLGAIINGHKNEPGNVILDAFRQRFPFGTVEVKVPDEYKPVTNAGTDFPPVPTAELKLRYDFEDYEIAEMVEIIHNLKIGVGINHSGFGKILSMDYGFDM